MLEGGFTTIADSFANFERHVLTGEVSDVRREYAKSVFYSGALMTMNLVSTILNGQQLTDDATTKLNGCMVECLAFFENGTSTMR